MVVEVLNGFGDTEREKAEGRSKKSETAFATPRPERETSRVSETVSAPINSWRVAS
jgi:hypothetical protein